MRLLIATAVVGMSAAVALGARSSPAIGTSTGPISTPQLRAVLVSRSTLGSQLTVKIACRGGLSTDTCSGPIMLTSKATTKIPAETVGTGSYSVASGQQSTVDVTLDAKGLSLLAQYYKLAATLTLSGTSAITKPVHFHYARINSFVSVTISFGRRSCSRSVSFLGIT